MKRARTGIGQAEHIGWKDETDKLRKSEDLVWILTDNFYVIW